MVDGWNTAGKPSLEREGLFEKNYECYSSIEAEGDTCLWVVC